MPSERLETAHGEIEYETVECVSCGNAVVKEDAKRMFIGDYSGTDLRGHLKMDDYDSGWVCPYCQDDPAGFPSPGRGVRLFKNMDEPWKTLTLFITVGGGVAILYAIVLLVVVLL